MSSSENTVCQICGMQAIRSHRDAMQDLNSIDCVRCGSYRITGTAQIIVGDPASGGCLLNSDEKKAAAGHWLRSMQRFEKRPFLHADKIKELAKNPYFPPLNEQLSLLLELIGNRCGSLGIEVKLSRIKDQYIFGATSPDTMKSLLEHLSSQGLLVFDPNDSISGDFEDVIHLTRLTVPGWLKYEDIKRGRTNGRKAFIAMPFGRRDLEEEWLPAVRKAVDETGFKLERVDDEPAPGLIDTKMRLEIRDARFLIVELTGDNLGAYWEAGFAEGLGKPVIYTCQSEVNPHFDVEHSFRVIWDSSDLDPAIRTLKATIRNALPDAAQEDQ